MFRNCVQAPLGRFGLEIRRFRPRAASGRRYSNFDEQSAISRLLEGLQAVPPFAVDIGAGDGESMSNTCALFRGGWSGLAVEWDAERFARLAFAYRDMRDVVLARVKADPGNVAALLRAAGTCRNFAFLSVDIDSYDHDLLAALLEDFRPALICAEINEKIPPPVRFAVKWHPDHIWKGDHFYGQSICMLEALAAAKGYRLVELEYNNAFLMPAELVGGEAPGAAALYRRGYLEKPDRLERLPWNRDMEYLRGLPAEKMVGEIRGKFAAYSGRFVCEIPGAA